MKKEIIPLLSRKEVKESIVANIEAWRNFAQRITKNPFVKAFILERDGNACSWCYKNLHEVKIIHHTAYDHICNYNKLIRISSPTVNNPNKTRLVPDCESCKQENNDRFMVCMSKLVLVHSICNKRISEQNGVEKLREFQ